MEGIAKWLARRNEENGMAIKKRLCRNPEKCSWEISIASKDFHAVIELEKKYVLSNVLGLGGYGVVVSAREYGDGKVERIALKLMVVCDRVRKTMERFIRELRIIGKIHHPFIVKVKGVINQATSVEEFREFYIVMERMRLSLQDLKEAHILQGIKFKPEVVKVILAQILRSLQYLHAARILHRDLKPHNILVSETNSNNPKKLGSFTPRIKLCDFGISRKIAPKMTGFVASAAYRAPEHFFGYDIYKHYFSYGPATDVWAVGCILAELLLVNELGPKGILFANVKDDETDFQNLKEFAKIIQIPDEDELPEIIKGRKFLYSIKDCKDFPLHPTKSLKELLHKNMVDKSAIDLVEKMLCFKATNRITIDEALQHEYVADLTVRRLAGMLDLKRDEINKVKHVNPPLVDTNDDEIQNTEHHKLIDLLFNTTKNFKIENA